MDRGGCQMSGGGGGDSSGPDNSGMITLEDLESFSEDQLSDSGNGSLEERETMQEEEESGRLLHYWQDVARGHQVEVAPEMAEPIQQLTTNNQGHSSREHVPFTLLGRKEKCGELLYEKRQYEKGHWACTTMREETYEQSICYGFMKIMRYICQQNSLEGYLGMTLPIVTVVTTDESHSTISNDVRVAPFTGPTNEVTIVQQINAMAEQLEPAGECVNDSFMVAGYTNPAHINRQNEIWFLERP
ncbi:hypothetical protein F7725_008129 [Dissostichus mawsoni]|uniref:Heme-binding protein 1 n=1 Tax=Dissostichus mawsoni TaxID=36200 RepID=A0A7J5Y699_DISMA|nr:hypothetical protein F7725_008129 [Dissostichus mawsoni]